MGLYGGVAHANESDFGGAARLTIQRRGHQGSLRAISLGDFGSFPSGSDDTVSEIGLLYGRALVSESAHVAVGAGVAVVGVNGCDDVEHSRICQTVGIPVSAEAAFQMGLFGLGVEGYANVNRLASYAGLGLFLQLGWLP